MRTIGGVCLGVGLAFGFSAWGWAEEQRPGSPPIMLDGHCPVTLIEQHRWEKGDARFGAIHEGRTYLFVGREEQSRFTEAPRKYAPPLPAEIAKPSAPVVGELGKPANWEIRGATTFTVEEIVKVLSHDIEVGSAARLGRPLDMFLKALADRARLGYQCEGFPDAKVEAFIDQARHKVVLAINEGPRFMAGEIRVTGTRTIDPVWLIEQLTPDTTIKPHADASRARSTAKKKGVLYWRSTSEPAWFDDVMLGRLRERVEALLTDLGRTEADFTLDVMPDRSRGIAPLAIHFNDEGRSITIDEIEIIGNHRSLREEVLDFLDLRPGLQYSSELRERINERLIHSGRFSTSSIKTVKPAKPGEPFKLRITITEYQKASPLSQPLSREEAALVRFSEWVRHFEDGEDDAIVKVIEATRVWEVVVSPRYGVLVYMRSTAASSQPDAIPFELALVADEHRIGMYSARRGRKFSAVPMDSPLLVQAVVTIHSGPPKFDGRGGLWFGMGLNTNVKKGKRRHVEAKLGISAVAALALAHLDESRCTWENGMLCVNYPDHHLWIEEQTGRLVEFGVDKAKEDEPQMQVMVARGEFERRLRQIDEVTAGFAETTEVTQGLSSACSFLCDEVLTWLPTTENTDTRRLVTILRQLAGAGIFRPCDRLLVEAFRPEPIRRKFWIPLPTFNVNVNEKTYKDIIKLAPYWGLHMGDALWPKGSWFGDLWREATLAAAGRTQDSAGELARQFWSPEIGPLQCLLEGELAQSLGAPRLAMVYASRGFPRLTLADFRHDYAPLVSTEGFVGQCVLSAADSLRRLSDEDRRVLIDAIVIQKWLAPQAAQAIGGALGRMQLDQRPIALALSAELDSQWANGLQTGVKSALVQLMETAKAKGGEYGAKIPPPDPPHDAPTWPLFELCQILSYADTYPAARIESMCGEQYRCPSPALDSQCPVTFRDEQVWRQGDDRFGAVHRGHVYLFTSAETQARFLADPDRYCPVDSGYDVVDVIEQHRDRQGKPEFVVVHDGRIYLFEGEETRAKFTAHPARYVVVASSIVAAADSGHRPGKPARR